MDSAYSNSENIIITDEILGKLTLVSGEKLPNPLELPVTEWLTNLQLWPSLEFPQIHLYLINTPSIYTHQNKGAYKSLDAYNYVICGHVQRVKYHPIKEESNYCFLMAEVLPSQRQGIKTQLYKAWVCLHKQNADVLTAYCTCMAGSGSVCSHAAAILFKIEMAVRNGLTKSVACTSQASAWNDMSRRKVNPAPLSEIDLTQPKNKGKSQKKGTKFSKTSEKKVIKVITESDILQLRTIYPQAAVLTSLDSYDGHTTDTDTASESGEILPQPLTSLYDPLAASLPMEDLHGKCDRIFHNLCKMFTKEQLLTLETTTRDQAENEVWHMHRKGRITASNAKLACTTTDANSVLRLNDSFMGYTKSFETEAMMWGKNCEKLARNEYKKMAEKYHENFQINDSGLVIPQSKPFIGATPDGYISCTCCGAGLLEIKCPYKYRTELVNFEADTSFCLSREKTLKKGHQYFYQIQLQMYACALVYCDFVVWTKNNLVITRVEKDETFLEETISKIQLYFIKYLLPEIVTRKNDPLNAQKVTCHVCSRPKFGKVIICTIQTCKKLYHYQCIGIKRSRKGWVCPSCT